MKKKILIVIAVVVLLILLIPIPMKLYDGGTIEYKALTYKISKVHRLNDKSTTGYEEGITIEILGMEIFNNVSFKAVEKDDATTTEIKLDEKSWIDSLTKINIKDRNDYFEITKKVKWEIPEHEEGATVSFAIAIPYTFVVDGKSFDGTYILDDANSSVKVEGTEYTLKVTNLTKEGKIEVLVTK